MVYFKQEDFNKCMEFLADKPDTVETQQELHKFMHDECDMLFDRNQITVKDFTVYIKVYTTATKCPKKANWCNTMSDGSQVVWNKKYQEFYMIDAVNMYHCDCTNYIAMFPEIKNINTWLLENWSNWRFVEMQKQLLAIWNGKYCKYFKNFWR